MKHTYKYLLIFCFSFSITMLSCRKKEEKYEGTETQTKVDSTGEIYYIDTTYLQEFTITYSKKAYTYTKVYKNDEGSVNSVHKNEIIDNEHYPFGEVYTDAQGNTIGVGGHLKFSGDSMYFTSSHSVNYEVETYAFSGKKN